ncbi:MAG: FimV family protein [Gammaproteobacteria bacterium]
MTIPRFAGFLIALAATPVAHALQLGQATTVSHRGEPLSARVELFGALPAGANDAPRVALLPVFGAAPDSLDGVGVRAALRTDASGVTYVELTSSAPLASTELAFRLQVGAGVDSLVRTYTLALPAPPPTPLTLPARTRPRRASVAPRAVSTPTVLPTAGNYGPVRSGQTLWQILVDHGLAGGDVAATMRDVVRQNPDAFVGGDANKLRAGAMLNLPGAAQTPAPAEPASVAPTAVPAADTPPSPAVDADTAARLARLAERFAEIRARYEAQQAAARAVSSSAPEGASAAGPASESQVDAREAAPAAAQSTQAPAPRPKAAPAPRTSAPAEPSQVADGVPWLALALCGLLVLALAAFGVRRWRARGQGAALSLEIRNADQAKLAEIAQKTGKRVELEDELRRTIGGKGRANEAPRGLSRVASL